MISDFEIEQKIQDSEIQDLEFWQSLSNLFCTHEETVSLNEWGTRHGCIECFKEVPVDLYMVTEDPNEGDRGSFADQTADYI